MLRVSNTLTVSTGAWTESPTSYTYQWQRSLDGVTWVNIGGATATTYVVQDGDVGYYIRTAVTAVGYPASATAYSNQVGRVYINSVTDLQSSYTSDHAYRIIHYNHGRIALGECYPNEPSFGMFLGRVGYINYVLPNSHSLATYANTAAYQTDWVLYYQDIPLFGGEHVSVGIDDTNSETIAIAGMDWKHYLETLFYRYDPANPTAYLYAVTARDIALIVQDLLNTSLAQTYTLPIVYNLSAIGQTINYRIDPADTEGLFSKIDALSKMSPGFDWDIDVNMNLLIWAPKRGTTRTLEFEHGFNCELTGYNDNGPIGTSLLGQASGLSAQMAAKADASTIAAYRRRDFSQDYGSVIDSTSLAALVASETELHGVDNLTFSLRWIKGSSMLNFFNECSLGDIHRVKAPIPYRPIDGLYRVVGIENRPNNEGDIELVVTFDDRTLSL